MAKLGQLERPGVGGMAVDAADMADAEIAIFEPTCGPSRAGNAPRAVAGDIVRARLGLPSVHSFEVAASAKMAMALSWPRRGYYDDVLTAFWRCGNGGADL